MTEKAVAKAAGWLAETPDDKKPHPVIPYLRAAYNLTPLEAVQAIRKADAMKARPE